jgi:hypothetical protein
MIVTGENRGTGGKKYEQVPLFNYPKLYFKKSVRTAQ